MLLFVYKNRIINIVVLLMAISKEKIKDSTSKSETGDIKKFKKFTRKINL
jgi:hypothetical protein